MAAPVMKSEALLARNTAMPAKSAGMVGVNYPDRSH
jgi:hypothetical protein